MLRSPMVERSPHASGGLSAGATIGFVLAVSASVVGAGGCGDAHPPLLPDEPAKGGDDAGLGLLGDGDPGVPSCSVGVAGGVCSCVDEPLDLNPPNLYFVLDRSGSMNDFGKWSTVQRVLAHLVAELGPRARFGVAALPDPSRGGCAPGVPVFPPAGGRVATVQGDPSGATGAVERALSTTLGHISASGGTPTAATFASLAPSIQKLQGKTFVIFATDGGPNCNAAATCTADMCTWNIEGDTVDGMSCMPAGPNCCAASSLDGSDACLDAQPTVAAVAGLAASGIPVYVVGLPESHVDPGSPPYPAYAHLLDQLAVAGGTGRGSEPQYYAVSGADQAALDAALSKIAGQITGACTLTLDEVPPDPTLVNVFLDGQPLGQSGADGWSLHGRTVTILGASCSAITNGDVLDIRVVAGCPTVIR